ncbi:acyltransferase family protein [Bdellovibrio sp.]|uniref:acyltransferase family protein n=1 Tax=Bdellovibrio sp. TaxID=28201 RepID=UPI0039E5271C
MFLSAVNTSSRENNLNLVRLIAATAVTFGHSFAMLTGYHYEFLPTINSSTFGFLAVAVFFGLSGFLITQSFCRQSNWKSYLLARCLRIFPGLCFANLITVILVSQIVRNQGFSMFADVNNWGYLIGGTFFKFYFYSDAFTGLPYTGPNGSLWTLPIEFHLYFLVMIMGLLGFFKHRLLLVGFTALSIFMVLLKVDFVVNEVFPHIFGAGTYSSATLSLPICFGSGMLAYLYRDKFYLSIPVAFMVLASLYLTENWLIRALAYIYAAYVFGYHPKLYIKNLNFKNDISYGVYVLSWPIQQSLIYTKTVSNPYALFLLSMTIVVPLAIFSWKMIEKPALRFKDKFSRGKAT